MAAGRQYTLLKLRYLEGLDAPAVQARLAVAKSQYYRDHARAVAAVADLLRERSADNRSPPESRGAPGLVGRLIHLAAPPANQFLGRGRELSELRQLLADARLVTLTGPPGIGKTLATAAATGAATWFADGASFVALSPVSGARCPVPGVRSRPCLANDRSCVRARSQSRTWGAGSAALVVADSTNATRPEPSFTVGASSPRPGDGQEGRPEPVGGGCLANNRRRRQRDQLRPADDGPGQRSGHPGHPDADAHPHS